jgi:ubiquitin-protein ligase
MLKTSYPDEMHLLTFIPKHLNKRIKNECLQVRNNYDEIIIQYTEEGIILATFKRKNNIYTFDIPSNYPFNAPKLSINGKSLSHLYDLKTNRFRHLLKYINGMDCFCCNSYLCKNNWGPALTLDKVICQIETFKTIKYWIFLKVILDKIKDKYLNRDIDLDSWLFNVYDPTLCYPGKPIH